MCAPDLVRTRGELSECLHAHAALREVDEVAFAPPFTFAYEDRVRILTGTATKPAPRRAGGPGPDLTSGPARYR
ncbi:hypothetical protein [Streptomyces sp. NPDC047706]|uniref:hypothetical protein n=1 Tax=Streptomyces sp. NPDC047706 TaxID=3365486 RepID=UPI003719758D